MRWAWWYNKHHIPEGYECHMGKRGGVCKPCHLHNFFISYWDSREEDFEGNVNRLWKSIHSDLLYHQPDPVNFLHNICEQIARDIPETQ